LGAPDLIKYDLIIGGALWLVIVLLVVKLLTRRQGPILHGASGTMYMIAFLIGAAYCFVQTPLNLVYNEVFDANYYIIYDFDFAKIKQISSIRGILLIPVAEELFFRRYVQDGLHKKLKPVIAIGIATVLFSLIHLPIAALFFNDMGFAPHTVYIAFFGGLLSGILYFKSRSVGPSIVMHVTWNLFAYII
jgi:membrane protease YdiL (CAAX protease family)